MRISFKKLAYFLISVSVLSSEAFSTNDFKSQDKNVTLKIFTHAVEKGDLKTLNALASTSQAFHNLVLDVVLSFAFQIDFIKFLNTKSPSDVALNLKSYAIKAADNIVATHLHSLNKEELLQLKDFYFKYVSGSVAKAVEVTDRDFLVRKKLADLEDRMEAYKVARAYFLSGNYQEGAKYSKLSGYRAPPNTTKNPIKESNIFVFVQGFAKANDFEGVKAILKSYYTSSTSSPYPIAQFIEAIPELKLHEAELKKLQK